MFGYLDPYSLVTDGKKGEIVFVNAATNEEEVLELTSEEDFAEIKRKLLEQHAAAHGITTELDAEIESIEVNIVIKKKRLTLTEVATGKILKIKNDKDIDVQSSDGKYHGVVTGVRSETKKEILVFRISFEKR